MQLRPPCDPSILGGLKGIRKPAALAGSCQWSQRAGCSRAFTCVTTHLLRLVGWASLQQTRRCNATTKFALDECAHRNV